MLHVGGSEILTQTKTSNRPLNIRTVKLLCLSDTGYLYLSVKIC